MVGVARGSGGSGVIPVCARMAGRASGRGSENHTRPRIRHAGALSLTAVQDLERSMERMKDLENVSPQKVAPKARKMIQAASKDLAANITRTRVTYVVTYVTYVVKLFQPNTLTCDRLGTNYRRPETRLTCSMVISRAGCLNSSIGGQTSGSGNIHAGRQLVRMALIYAPLQLPLGIASL